MVWFCIVHISPNQLVFNALIYKMLQSSNLRSSHDALSLDSQTRTRLPLPPLVGPGVSPLNLGFVACCLGRQFLHYLHHTFIKFVKSLRISETSTLKEKEKLQLFISSLKKYLLLLQPLSHFITTRSPPTSSLVMAQSSNCPWILLHVTSPIHGTSMSINRSDFNPKTKVLCCPWEP